MFFMMITQKDEERSVYQRFWASPQDIQKIILGEATLIGCIGGILGVLFGLFAGSLVDALAAQLPRFHISQTPFSFFLGGYGV